MNRLDLNLLVALDALLQEQSVTRAGERLGVSQPTMSASLGRLRRHFNDELLYRSGNIYKLTPLAVQLSGRTAVTLTDVRRVFAIQSTFDPSTSVREFQIASSDYVATLAGPPLMQLMAEQAPRMRVHFEQGAPDALMGVEERLRSVDGLLMPHGFLHGLPHLDLFRDEWACIVAADNPTVGETLTMDDLERLPWAVNFRSPTSTTTSMRVLSQLGVQVKVQVTVDAFLLVPQFVLGTDRIALVPRRLAEHFFPTQGLRVLRCPFDAGPIVHSFWWHPDFERDVEHVWLRAQLAEVARTLAEDDQADGQQA